MARPFVRRRFTLQALLPALLLAAAFGRPNRIGAQPLFKADAPLTVTIA